MADAERDTANTDNNNQNLDEVIVPEDEPNIFRDHRQHGKASGRLDDDALEVRTEEERVDAGLEADAPDEIPPATD